MQDARSVQAGAGTPLAYHVFGDPAGAPVMLVHGLAAGGAQFGDDARRLAANGYRVLVPDLRGHGGSAKPISIGGESFSPSRMADDLLRVLDHAGIERVDWVGNSLGGILALQLLPEHERRLRTLALFGTAFRLDLPRFVPSLFPLAYRVLGPGWLAQATARLTTPDPKGRAIVASLVRRFDPMVGKAIADHIRRYDLTGTALRSRVPLLLMRGGRDVLINRALNRALPLLQGRKGFQLAHLPGAGHCANLDAPELFHQTLARFWAQADAQSKFSPS